MVTEFVDELIQEQFLVVGTRNVPNNIFDQVNWYTLDDLKEKLTKLHQVENHLDLNKVDA